MCDASKQSSTDPPPAEEAKKLAETNVDTLEETDPELLELKLKIQEEKERNERHIREKTCDLEARLGKEIEAAYILAEDAARKEDTKETEGTSSVPEELPAEQDPLLDENLKQYLDHVADEPKVEPVKLEELKLPLEEAQAEPEPVQVEAPFSRKNVEKSGQDAKLIIPRAQPKHEVKLVVKTPIYDLLLEKTGLHTCLIQEYELRKLLSKNERFAKDRYVVLVVFRESSKNKIGTHQSFYRVHCCVHRFTLTLGNMRKLMRWYKKS